MPLIRKSKYRKKKSTKAWRLAKSAARSVIKKSSELKRKILYHLDQNVGDPSVPWSQSMVEIPQGDGQNQRIGNQVRLKSVFARLFLQIPYNNNVIQQNSGAVFRVVMYTPKSSNLFPNYPTLTDKTKKFPVLDDFDLIAEKWITINPAASTMQESLGAAQVTNSYQQRMITISKKFPYLGRKLEYDTANTYPNSGQVMLAVYGYGNLSAIANSLKISGMCTCYYYDN